MFIIQYLHKNETVIITGKSSSAKNQKEQSEEKNYPCLSPVELQEQQSLLTLLHMN